MTSWARPTIYIAMMLMFVKEPGVEKSVRKFQLPVGIASEAGHK